MSTAQRISIGFGIVYLAVGVLGFVPGITAASSQPGQGLLLGVFAVNTLHNLVHLVLGAALVWAGLSPHLTITINRALAIVFLVLVPASLLAPIAEGVAINVPDTLLHLGSAVVTGYVGFGLGRTSARSAA